VVRIGLVGLGKMGLSHLSIANAHPDAGVVAVCDSLGFGLDILRKYTHVDTYADVDRMLAGANLDAVIIATPSSSHFDIAKTALLAGVHVFCEKPLTLSSAQSMELAQLAAAGGLVTQVGYHNRFIATFQEVHRLLQLGAIGKVSHVLAESYGPVVLKAKGTTWRSKRVTGGGCLYDYAAHPIDLLQWFFGEPDRVRGTVMHSIFSSETDDEVYSTLLFPGDVSAQLSVNWSDESQRKMTTGLTIWGEKGKITADRQELHTYFRSTATPPDGYASGWNVRYTTDLTAPVAFYLRGEEYSAQLDHFISAITAARNSAGTTPLLGSRPLNSFASAAVTDRILEALIIDAERTSAAEQRSVSTGDTTHGSFAIR